MPALKEAGKDVGRNTVFAAIGVVVTYFVNGWLPMDMPVEVRNAALVIVLAGVTYAVMFIDSLLHHLGSKIKMPF